MAQSSQDQPSTLCKYNLRSKHKKTTLPCGPEGSLMLPTGSGQTLQYSPICHPSNNHSDFYCVDQYPPSSGNQSVDSECLHFGNPSLNPIPENNPEITSENPSISMADKHCNIPPSHTNDCPQWLQHFLLAQQQAQQHQAEMHQEQQQRLLDILMARTSECHLGSYKESSCLKEDTTYVYEQRLQAIEKRLDKIKSFKEGQDIEAFIDSCETQFELNSYPPKYWKSFLAARLPAELTQHLADILRDSSSSYLEVKQRLLAHAGLNSTQAASQFFSVNQAWFTSKSPAQIERTLKRLGERIANGATSVADTILQFIIALAKFHFHKEIKQDLERAKPCSWKDFITVLDNYYSIHGTLAETPSPSPIAKSNYRPNQSIFPPCYICGKRNHQANKCWFASTAEVKASFIHNSIPVTSGPVFTSAPVTSGSISNTSQVSSPASNLVPPTNLVQSSPVTCYHCGTPGHKAPSCPLRSGNSNFTGSNRGVGRHNGDGIAKPVSSVTVHKNPYKPNLIATLAGQSFYVQIDTGADISVLPQDVVPSSCFTGHSILCSGYGGSVLSHPTAQVTLDIAGTTWSGEVAVAPAGCLTRNALLAVNPFDPQQLTFLNNVVAYSQSHIKTPTPTYDIPSSNILPPTTDPHCSQSPTTTPVPVGALQADDLEAALRSDDEDIENDIYIEESASEVIDGEKSEDDGEGEDQDVSLSNVKEPASLDTLSASLGEEQDKCIADQIIPDGREEEVSMDFPAELEGDSSDLIPDLTDGDGKEELVKETLADSSLAKIREHATNKCFNYYWKNGVLFKTVHHPHTGEPRRVIVVPHKWRSLIINTAHTELGHPSYKRTISAITKNFHWPSLYSQVKRQVEACQHCQLVNAGGAAKAPMVERPVISVPHEVVAVDLVGPFPKGRGGATHLLTMTCMATRWPDAVPLRSTSTKSVAQACVQIFLRNGFPRVILSDNGPQFSSSLWKEVAKLLNVERVFTSPYHPQANGVLERFHRTLKAYLVKAHSQGQDWVSRVPYAIFAFRQLPNRSTGFSPSELVLGRSQRTSLDALVDNWCIPSDYNLNVSSWLGDLQEKLQTMRDTAAMISAEQSALRKKYYDRTARQRKPLAIKDKVLYRIPGHSHKLALSWEGPFSVEKKLGPVTYLIKEVGGMGREKRSHMNNLKPYKETPLEIRSLMALADEGDIVHSCPILDVQSHPDFSPAIVESLVTEFPQVFSKVPGQSNVAPASIHIPQNTPIISQAPYAIPKKLLTKVKEELDKLVEQGILEESRSLWCSPLVIARKSDGRIRLCVDFRKINDITPQLQVYLPTLDDILEHVGQSQILSTLDLAKGFHQIELDPSSMDLTTFACPFGRFRYRRLPFGLKNAPAYFQATMLHVLKYCIEFCQVYIDDLIVYSDSVEQHLHHLRQVLAALAKAGLTVNVDKCQFGKTRLKYLGLLVGGGQLQVPEARVEALKNYIQPVKKKDLKAFLGLVSYYRQFIPNLADSTALLSPAVSSKAPDTVQWTPSRLEAFHVIRKSLCSHVILTVPTVSDQFQLHTDASGVGVGAVLYVIRHGVCCPVAFFSRQLRGAETRYSSTEKEALAVVTAVDHFQQYLYGTHFKIVTDHRPLVYLATSRKLNRRLMGFALRLNHYDHVIVYRRGEDHLDADAMSRQAWPQSSDHMADLNVDVHSAIPAHVFGGGPVGPPATI